MGGYSFFFFNILMTYLVIALYIIGVVYILLAMIKVMFFNPWLASKERMFQIGLEKEKPQNEKEPLQE